MEQVVENGNVLIEDAPKEVFSPMDTNSLPRSQAKSEPGTGLLRAARAGNLEKVLEFLKAGVDINTCNANGLNALHLASKDGHVNVVRELLERGANVNATTKKGNAAIHIASLAGQEEVVRILIEHGANVNLQSTNGFTPLYMASQENHDGIVKLLLANGANQSLATEDMFTPLAVAMQQGHDKVVAILLESDVRGKVRLPALHIAAKKDDCKAAALLLQSSANPDVTSKSQFTPLHIAAHYGNLNVATLLLDRGADVNYQAKHNITPLHVAAKWGKAQVCALLLDRGGSIEAKTRDGLTPLHCAARSGHEQVVDLLLERGAPISAKTKNGIVPLAMCAQGDHVDAARILLYHKAPVDDVTVDYLTSLHVAAHCGHVRIAKLLLDRKADPNARALNGFTPLHIACKKNRIKVVELLLKNGAHIEAATESGLTPLHVASFMGSMNIAIFLLQNGAKPDATTVRGETPLHLAARANQTDIVRILLRNGANVDAAAKEGQTPLHIASRLGNADLVMLLLQHGAKVDAPTKEMYTALHVAAKAGQEEVEKFLKQKITDTLIVNYVLERLKNNKECEEVASILLDKGADEAAKTSRGWTPLHLAGKYNTGNTKVANLLISRGAPVNAEGKNQLTPLHTSCHHKNNEVALLLLNNSADPKCLAKNAYSPLHIAAKQNQIDIATALLEYGADVNGQSRQGYTPIHLAADQGHTDMVSLLIHHGADANAGAKNLLRPLHLAAQNDHVPSANVLVSSGSAEIDSQTQSGYSPLHVASHFGQAGMVRYLLQNGANVHLVTEAGNTPLHHAAQQGQTLIITLLLEKKADPDAVNKAGQNPLAIAEKLGYVSVVETLKIVTTTITTTTTTTTTIEERYKVLAPETMNENLASDSEDEGAEDAGNEAYRYLTVDDMKSLGDDSLPIDVTRDEQHHRDSGYMHGDENIVSQKYNQLAADNVDISRSPVQIGKLHWRNFLVSFMVDARGGAMRGCRHSGVRVIIPPRKAASPMRITCRYLKKDRLVHPPPLMEGEALASRILELGPSGAKFLGPVILEVPHFASLRNHEREIVILRSDNGETWREHNLDATEEAVQDVLNESFDANDLKQLEDLKTNRITRILTTDFPQYFALVSRIRQEVHAVGPEGGMVSSTVVPQVQAVFPQGALTKRIKVGLQAQPIHTDLVNKVAGSRVSVSPIVTVEPRRRKFHKPITLTIPVPKSQDPNSSLRLLCSITGGTTRAQWEDVTGSTPLTFVNDCVSFTTTVSARFWLVDCRHASHDVTRMATDLYREAIHVPFMAKFVIFAKRIETTEARLRVFCMTDDREEKTLEGQEHFTEVAKSRDVEVLEGKHQWVEMAGNLAPVTKSGDQLKLKFIAFKENRLPFLVRQRDPASDPVGRIIFMRDSKSAQKGEQPPVCNLNIVLPDQIMPDEPSLPASVSSSPRLPIHTNRYNIKNVAYSSAPRHTLLTTTQTGPGEIHRADLKISDVANLLDDDWIPLARNLGVTDPDIAIIEAEYPQSPHQQATVMLRLWMQQAGDRATGNTLEKALNSIGRGDIVSRCIGNIAPVTDASEKILAQSEVTKTIQIISSSKDKRNLSLDVSYDEQDLMKDSESLEELSQTDNYRANKARMKSMSPTDEETVFEGKNVMTSSYERDEHKYLAEEKVCAKVHWDGSPGDRRSKSEEGSVLEESQASAPYDTGISMTLRLAMEGDTEGEVSDFSLTSPKKDPRTGRFTVTRSFDEDSSSRADTLTLTHEHEEEESTFQAPVSPLGSHLDLDLDSVTPTEPHETKTFVKSESLEIKISGDEDEERVERKSLAERVSFFEEKATFKETRSAMRIQKKPSGEDTLVTSVTTVTTIKETKPGSEDISTKKVEVHTEKRVDGKTPSQMGKKETQISTDGKEESFGDLRAKVEGKVEAQRRLLEHEIRKETQQKVEEQVSKESTAKVAETTEKSVLAASKVDKESAAQLISSLQSAASTAVSMTTVGSAVTVDKACSPHQVGSPERPEMTSKSQQASYAGVDMGVGTSPKETGDKDVLTRLHNLTNIPVDDDEIYKQLKDQEAELKEKEEHGDLPVTKIIHSEAIKAIYSGAKRSISEFVSPTTTVGTGIHGDDDEMQFDLSIEEDVVVVEDSEAVATGSRFKVEVALSPEEKKDVGQKEESPGATLEMQKLLGLEVSPGDTEQTSEISTSDSPPTVREAELSVEDESQLQQQDELSIQKTQIVSSETKDLETVNITGITMSSTVERQSVSKIQRTSESSSVSELKKVELKESIKIGQVPVDSIVEKASDKKVELAKEVKTSLSSSLQKVGETKVAETKPTSSVAGTKKQVTTEVSVPTRKDISLGQIEEKDIDKQAQKKKVEVGTKVSVKKDEKVESISGIESKSSSIVVELIESSALDRTTESKEKVDEKKATVIETEKLSKIPGQMKVTEAVPEPQKESAVQKLQEEIKPVETQIEKVEIRGEQREIKSEEKVMLVEEAKVGKILKTEDIKQTVIFKRNETEVSSDVGVAEEKSLDSLSEVAEGREVRKGKIVEQQIVQICQKDETNRKMDEQKPEVVSLTETTSNVVVVKKTQGTIEKPTKITEELKTEGFRITDDVKLMSVKSEDVIETEKTSERVKSKAGVKSESKARDVSRSDEKGVISEGVEKVPVVSKVVEKSKGIDFPLSTADMKPEITEHHEIKEKDVRKPVASEPIKTDVQRKVTEEISKLVSKEPAVSSAKSEVTEDRSKTVTTTITSTPQTTMKKETTQQSFGVSGAGGVSSLITTTVTTITKTSLPEEKDVTPKEMPSLLQETMSQEPSKQQKVEVSEKKSVDKTEGGIVTTTVTTITKTSSSKSEQDYITKDSEATQLPSPKGEEITAKLIKKDDMKAEDAVYEKPVASKVDESMSSTVTSISKTSKTEIKTESGKEESSRPMESGIFGIMSGMSSTMSSVSSKTTVGKKAVEPVKALDISKSVVKKSEDKSKTPEKVETKAPAPEPKADTKGKSGTTVSAGIGGLAGLMSSTVSSITVAEEDVPLKSKVLKSEDVKPGKNDVFGKKEQKPADAVDSTKSAKAEADKAISVLSKTLPTLVSSTSAAVDTKTPERKVPGILAKDIQKTLEVEPKVDVPLTVTKEEVITVITADTSKSTGLQDTFITTKSSVTTSVSKTPGDEKLKEEIRTSVDKAEVKSSVPDTIVSSKPEPATVKESKVEEQTSLEKGIGGLVGLMSSTTSSVISSTSHKEVVGDTKYSKLETDLKSTEPGSVKESKVEKQLPLEEMVGVTSSKTSSAIFSSSEKAEREVRDILESAVPDKPESKPEIVKSTIVNETKAEEQTPVEKGVRGMVGIMSSTTSSLTSSVTSKAETEFKDVFKTSVTSKSATMQEVSEPGIRKETKVVKDTSFEKGIGGLIGAMSSTTSSVISSASQKVEKTLKDTSEAVVSSKAKSEVSEPKLVKDSKEAVEQLSLETGIGGMMGLMSTTASSMISSVSEKADKKVKEIFETDVSSKSEVLKSEIESEVMEPKVLKEAKHTEHTSLEKSVGGMVGLMSSTTSSVISSVSQTVDKKVKDIFESDVSSKSEVKSEVLEPTTVKKTKVTEQASLEKGIEGMIGLMSSTTSSMISSASEKLEKDVKQSVSFVESSITQTTKEVAEPIVEKVETIMKKLDKDDKKAKSPYKKSVEFKETEIKKSSQSEETKFEKTVESGGVGKIIATAVAGGVAGLLASSSSMSSSLHEFEEMEREVAEEKSAKLSRSSPPSDRSHSGGIMEESFPEDLLLLELQSSGSDSGPSLDDTSKGSPKVGQTLSSETIIVSKTTTTRQEATPGEDTKSASRQLDRNRQTQDVISSLESQIMEFTEEFPIKSESVKKTSSAVKKTIVPPTVYSVEKVLEKKIQEDASLTSSTTWISDDTKQIENIKAAAEKEKAENANKLAEDVKSPKKVIKLPVEVEGMIVTEEKKSPREMTPAKSTSVGSSKVEEVSDIKEEEGTSLEEEIARLEKEVFEASVEERRNSRGMEKVVENLSVEKKTISSHHMETIKEKPDLNLFQQLCVVQEAEESREGVERETAKITTSGARETEVPEPLIKEAISAVVSTKGDSKSSEDSFRIEEHVSFTVQSKILESKVETTEVPGTSKGTPEPPSSSSGISSERSPIKKPSQLVTDVEAFVEEAREAAEQLKKEVKILRPDLTPTPTDQATTPVLRAMLGLGTDVGGWFSDEDKLETVMEVAEEKVSPVKKDEEVPKEESPADEKDEQLSMKVGDSLSSLEQEPSTEEDQSLDVISVVEKSPVKKDDPALPTGKEVSPKKSSAEKLSPGKSPGKEFSPDKSPVSTGKPSPVKLTLTPMSKSPKSGSPSTKSPTCQSPGKEDLSVKSIEPNVLTTEALQVFDTPQSEGIIMSESETKGSSEFKEAMYFREYSPKYEPPAGEVPSPTTTGSPPPTSTATTAIKPKSPPLSGGSNKKEMLTSQESLVRELKFSYSEGAAPSRLSPTKEKFLKDLADVECKDKDRQESEALGVTLPPSIDTPLHAREPPLTLTTTTRQHISRDVSSAEVSKKSGGAMISPEAERKVKRAFGPTKLVGKRYSSSNSLPDLQYRIQYSELPRPKSAPAVITSEMFVKTLDFVYSQRGEVVEKGDEQLVEPLRIESSSGDSSAGAGSSSRAATISSPSGSGSPRVSTASDRDSEILSLHEGGSAGSHGSRTSSVSSHKSEVRSRIGSGTFSQGTTGSGGTGGSSQGGSSVVGTPGTVSVSVSGSAEQSNESSKQLSRSGSEASSHSSRKSTGTSGSSSGGSSKGSGAEGSSDGTKSTNGGSGSGVQSLSITSGSGSGVGSGSGQGSESRSSVASSPISISLSGGSRTSESTEVQLTRLSPPRMDSSGQFPSITESLAPFISFTYSVKERDLPQAPSSVEETIERQLLQTSQDAPGRPVSPFTSSSPSPLRDDRGSPIHAEVKLLVRTSDNGRESVEIRSVKEHVLPHSPLAKSPPPPPISTTPTISPVSSSPDSEGRMESPIIHQKLVVRFHDGSLGHQQVESSPSRVVENIGTFQDRKAFWDDKDEEEKKKRESVSSLEEFTGGIENTGFIGEAVIDEELHPPAKLRTPSPYEIERSKEAIFLDEDDIVTQGVPPARSPERKVLFEEEKRISREIFEAELEQPLEEVEPESKAILGGSGDEDSERSGPHQPSDASLREVRTAATSLVREIETSVEQKLGIEPKPSLPSSVDITDEELLSTGDVSSPETQRSAKKQEGGHLGVEESAGASCTGTGDTYAVRSSSSGEFHTAHEDSTLRSSSDDPTRPKSWDSSILGQVSGQSEYETAMSAASVASSQASYLGSLSSDASYSETLVASQIDLGRELTEESPEGSPIPPALPPRDNIPSQSQAVAQGSPSKVSQRSVHCEAGTEGTSTLGYPITLTSSTSGTTVCTQVETTFESRVLGDPEREDNQEGNIFMTGVVQDIPRKTHRRSESQSWSDALLYGIEEKIEEEQAKEILEEEEISDLFTSSGKDSERDEDPIERPVTPEPGFSPEERKTGYYPGSSFDQHEQTFHQEIEDATSPREYGTTHESIFERMIQPMTRLEDIEEENGSLKNSPKSVQSMEIQIGSSGPEWGNGNGDKGRPGSRESTSSLKEFESLESAVLEEEGSKVELSEIEEGHESGVSEADEETEVGGGDDSVCDDSSSAAAALLMDSDAKMMAIFSERVELRTDSESSESGPPVRPSRRPRDPIAFFTTTVSDLRSPDTDTSALEDLNVRCSSFGGTTDADSSLEFQRGGRFTREATGDSMRMTSSGDSLDEPAQPQSSANLMEVSGDSLDLEKESGQQGISQQMTDSLQGKQLETGGGMADSLELASGQGLPSGVMSESADSLTSGGGLRSSYSGTVVGGAAGGQMLTSTDSLEGGQGIAEANLSTSSSTAADAAMWSSTGGSISTLVSSQEDLTLENQF